MSISFERFIGLTAALAAASTAVAGCGSDDSPSASPAGGSAGKGSAGKGGAAGKGGSAGKGGTSGKSGGGTAGRATGGSSAMGNAGQGGEAALGGSGGTASGGRAGRGGAGTGGSSTGTGGNAEGGESGMQGTSGAPGAGEGGMTGEAGAGPVESCFGDEGVTRCGYLTDPLPTDECLSGPNPAILSCYYSEGLLRYGVLEGLGACLGQVTDACTVRAAVATDACEKEALRRACVTAEAADVCENGLDLGGGSTLASPLSACDDGTLTLASCTQALSAITSGAYFDVVTCSDPASEYGSVFSGTCAERLQQCIFPHGPLY